ncbi:sensor histidine kinase [Parablastomonas sp. CN1-191]|uniref:sensor histidine kinase n=1 Tax=Parablastomonas sp. CN1-191 TaxID=3400908 RepID=UPI003BF8F96F
MDPAALNAAIVESSDAAIIAKSLDGTVIAWNASAEALFGWSAAEMIGRSVRTIVPADRQDEEDAILARIAAGERVDTFTTVRLYKGGGQVPVEVLVSPVRDADGTIVGAASMARSNMYEPARRRLRSRNEDRVRLMGDNLPVMAWVGDRDGVLRWGNRQFRDFFGLTESEVDGFDWSAAMPASEREDMLRRVTDAVDDSGGWEATMPLRRRSDGETRWMLARSVPMLDIHGKLYLRFGTATDITDQRRADDRVRLLLKEVNHRTRNMMAVIQSMAKRTAASGADYMPRLECRIAGLAATQDILVRHDWAGVPVADLIAAQVAVAGQDPARFDLSGPDLGLSSGAAESIGMAINELAINAAEYGALSVPAGRVEIDWGLVPTGGEDDFAIAWHETGGPPVQPPRITGFGSRIIEDVPRGKLCGAVDMAYAEAGLRWRLVCPARLALASDEDEI